MDAAEVKALAKSYGADIVGIASAKVLNAFPPDPQWPQTPERIRPYVKSVIVICPAIPVAVFPPQPRSPVQYMDMLVLDVWIASPSASPKRWSGTHPASYRRAGADWTLKRASYGRLSTAPSGLEAGSARSGSI